MGGGQSSQIPSRNQLDNDPEYRMNDTEEANPNSQHQQQQQQQQRQQYQQQQGSYGNQTQSYSQQRPQGNQYQGNSQMNSGSQGNNANYTNATDQYGYENSRMNPQRNQVSYENSSLGPRSQMTGQNSYQNAGGRGPQNNMNMRAPLAREEELYEEEEEEKGPEGQRLYLMSNNPSQIRTSEIQEDLPKMPRFVKNLKSGIPYPTDPSHFVRQKLFEKYEFAENSNIFYVNEEEKKAVVHRSEALKPFMVLKEVTNGEWIDDGLPATVESIIKDPSKHGYFKQVVWKKLSEIAPIEGLQILSETNVPTGIKCGLLNNKALQSALSILTENEANIPSLFSEFNETSPSIFSIWLNNTNEWRVYMLDEFFPYDMESETWAFTTSGNETWALILEKALAKMYGSYYALQRGHPAHFIYDLMGAPYRHFYYDNPDQCWNFLISIDRATTTIVAMNKEPRYRIADENDIFKEPSYSYAVIDLQDVKTSRGNERLVKLRNSWDEDKWTGDWSKDSPKWTPHLLKKLNPDGLSDDVFWMNINDFVKYYGLGFTFQVFPDYLHCSLRLKHSFKRNYSLLLMNIQTPGKLFLTVSQRDQKHFVNYEERYVYSLVKLMIVQVDEKLQFRRFVTGLYDKGRDCDIEVNFEAGDYMIYLEVDWQQSMNREIVISTFGETTSVFYELNSLEDKMDLLKKFFASYFKSRPTADTMTDYGNLGDKRVRRYVDYIYGYLCFYYLNSSDLFKLVEKVRMESIYGLEITPPFSDNFEFEISVPENSDFQVVYRTTLEGQVGYHSKHTSWSYLFPNAQGDTVKKLIVSKAKKVMKRKLMGKEIDIILYVYAFNGGFSFYYTNKTEYTYRERLGIDLFNLVDAGEEDANQQTYFRIVLGPGQDYLMQFRVKNPTLPFSYTSRASYKIHLTPQDYHPNMEAGYENDGGYDEGYEGEYNDQEEGQSEHNGGDEQGFDNNGYGYNQNQMPSNQYHPQAQAKNNQMLSQQVLNKPNSVNNSFNQYIKGYGQPQRTNLNY